MGMYTDLKIKILAKKDKESLRLKEFIDDYGQVHNSDNIELQDIQDIYFNDKSQRNDAKVAAKKLDYSVLPSKYKYLFNMPYCIAYILYLITEYRLKLKNK